MPIKKKKSIALKLRNYFVTGVIVLIPIGFTLYLSKFLINFSTKLVPSGLNPNTYLTYAIPGINIFNNYLYYNCWWTFFIIFRKKIFTNN